MSTFEIPLIIRGEVIKDHLVEFTARDGQLRFLTPDVAKYAARIPLSNPREMANMYALSFDEIVDYLEQLAQALAFDDNRHMQQAYALSCQTSGLSPEMLMPQYRDWIPGMFAPDQVREITERRIGIARLEGWTREELLDGRLAFTRPLGARCMHITAGNAPLCAGQTVLWNCITRGDAVVKSPSNDPLTSLAIGQTMIDMAPDHPLTKHYSVCYWKGGNVAFERELYAPENFEKIVAWGGFSSMKHVTRYLQPGLELVAMDPKLSATIIGEEAFQSEERMRHVAGLLAIDFGGLNQEGCSSARVISVQSGTDDAGIHKLKRLADYTLEALAKLPPEITSPVTRLPVALKQEIEAIYDSSFYHVAGNAEGGGAIIVSLIPEPVDFASELANRVANFVPFDDIEEALDLITVHTQTIGVYPETLKEQHRETLAFMGGQRIVSLGGHLTMSWSLPHDAIEPIRRLCRWINDENIGVEGYRGRRLFVEDAIEPAGE